MIAGQQKSTGGEFDTLARRAARLAAVQAVYQMEVTELDAETVIDEFLSHRFSPDLELTPAGRPDEAFFADIVRGIPRRQSEIDGAIAKCLSVDWTFARIDSILRAILRAATYELIGRLDVPAKAIIDEYLDIAHAFFQGDEVGFVNATLDRIARGKRAEELGKFGQNGEPRA